MPTIRFEDEKIDIEEDVQTVSTQYDIQKNILIAKKVLDKVITSEIYNYEDGISAYLKFDDAGTNQFIDIMFAIYKANGEKKIATIPRCADAVLKRVDKSHFHLVVTDTENNNGSLIFITLKNEKDIHITQLNYTELVEYKLVDEKFVFVNCYEDLASGRCIQTMAVYNYSGKLIESLFDKHIMKGPKFEYVEQIKPDGTRVIIAMKRVDGKPHVVGKFTLPDKISAHEKNMREKNKEIIKNSGGVNNVAERGKKQEENEQELIENENYSEEVSTQPKEDNVQDIDGGIGEETKEENVSQKSECDNQLKEDSPKDIKIKNEGDKNE